MPHWVEDGGFGIQDKEPDPLRNRSESQNGQVPPSFTPKSLKAHLASRALNNVHVVKESTTNSDSSNSMSSFGSLPLLISSASTYDTMPLMTPPDSMRDLAELESDQYLLLLNQNEYWTPEMWQAHRLEVREGKKPQRPICYDSLIADLPGGTSDDQPRQKSGDDNDEWWGLDYMVQLSRRQHDDPHLSNYATGGEHSRSRQSWAVIHEALTHPMYQNEEFQRWKSWHRYLDQQTEQRKIDRMRTFYEFSLLYLHERKLREWLFWQTEFKAEISDVDEVYKRLKIISVYRPDPYVPPMKRDVAWVLKRSRSVGSLRELVAMSL